MNTEETQAKMKDPDRPEAHEIRVQDHDDRRTHRPEMRAGRRTTGEEAGILPWASQFDYVP